jgi:hypothetical protein
MANENWPAITLTRTDLPRLWPGGGPKPDSKQKNAGIGGSISKNSKQGLIDISRAFKTRRLRRLLMADHLY